MQIHRSVEKCKSENQWKFAKCAARSEDNISKKQCGQCSRRGPGTPPLATYPGDGKLISEFVFLDLRKK